jgi:hypothetical protein
MSPYQNPTDFVELYGFSSYLISPITGQIFDRAKDVFVDFHLNNGYQRTTLISNENKKVKVYLHKILAQQFLAYPKVSEKLYVNHIDGNRLNNNLNNLEWVTNRENSCHGRKSKSKYIGVSYEKDRGLYKASILYQGKRLTLGRFDNPLSALNSLLEFEINHNLINKYRK